MTMRTFSKPTVLAACALFLPAFARAEDNADRVCPRPVEGAIVAEPPAILSKDGVLDVNLTFKSALDSDGAPRYCYLAGNGFESPTLRVSPGDRLSIHFQNDLAASDASAPMTADMDPASAADSACHGTMTPASTNLHFHGLVMPPVCHRDESIHTLVAPGQSFDYNVRIPANNPPGLYWYHPHPHGFSEAQVQGGASGALIVDGIDSAVPAVSGMTHRTFILRDQLLPAAEAKSADPLLPSWDVSINYVPIKYPAYIPATILIRPKERQFWRVVNAAANTIFNLRILYDEAPQLVEIYALDGVPVSQGPIVGSQVYIPPGARVEFVVTGPAKGQSARLITQKIDSGPAGDSAPARPLANLVTTGLPKTKRGAPPAGIDLAAKTGGPPRFENLLDLKAARTRNLHFSQNGNGTEGGAGAATKFFITVLGQPVKPFDMDDPPNIVARQGTVEDWNIQNPTPEDHIFHMHQVHFQVIALDGVPIDDPVIRDTIRVPHQRGRTPISSVRIRVDFRDPAIVGDFVYHSHILGHEDKGMMGKIRILPAETEAGAKVPAADKRRGETLAAATPSASSH